MAARKPPLPDNLRIAINNLHAVWNSVLSSPQFDKWRFINAYQNVERLLFNAGRSDAMPAVLARAYSNIMTKSRGGSAEAEAELEQVLETLFPRF
ncbi:MAG TPA: hypothetical protein VF824_18065 [Thermoanaerobaculia bacterium]|jgi:hypothetical protein